MNKKIWTGMYLASFAVFAFFLVLLLIGLLIQVDGVLVRFDEMTMTIALILGGLAYLQFIIVATIYNFAILAKMWGSIQDGVTPITVGKAIGFLFIPVFSVYWIFRAWGSYPGEYNKYLDRHQLNAPKLSSGAFVLFPVMLLLTAFLLFPLLVLPFVFAAVIARTADSVNNLAAAREFQSKGLPPGAYGTPSFAPARTSTRVLIAGGLAAAAAFIGLISVFGFATYNSKPRITEADVPATVGNFKLKDKGFSGGSIFGLRKNFYATYADAADPKKTISYDLTRYTFERHAGELDREAYLCNADDFRKESQINDASGKQVGTIVTCSKGVKLRNGSRILELEPASDYTVSSGSAVRATNEELLHFAKALAFNAEVAFGDLDIPQTPGQVTASRPKNDQPVIDTEADFSLTAKQIDDEMRSSDTSSVFTKFNGKTISISGRYYPLGKFDGDRITLHAGSSTLSANIDRSQASEFARLQENDRIRIRCRGAGEYIIELSDCRLMENRGTVSIDDTPDHVFTAKEYYDLVDNYDVNFDERYKNTESFREKIIKVTGPVEEIGRDKHHMTVGEMKWITCEPDKAGEAAFSRLKNGQQAAFMGVGTGLSTLKHCIVVPD